MKTQSLQDRVLTALHPSHGLEPPALWQQRKSARTRQRLIDATIDCLVEDGYSGLSTATVAERSGISRGTMHHHFATRLDLILAVIEDVFYRRMRGFLEDYFAALQSCGEERLVEAATEMHWRSVQTREYAAYLELALAARTDAELEPHFNRAARRYDDVWTGEMIEAFPQWRVHWQALKLANDFTIAAHMGMLVHRPVFGEGERMERLRLLVLSVVQSLYDSPGD